MNILVTGGTGFIGSHTIVELYNSGMRAINIDNLSNSEAFINDRVDAITHNLTAGKAGKQTFIEGDISDEEVLRKVFSSHAIDAVIHFAAYKSVNESVEKPLEYYKNNIGSTLTLLKIMQEFNVNKLVFSSSCTVYGQPDQLPVTENSPIKHATTPYGFTKQICEQVILDFAKANPHFSSIILRYFNPVGAHFSGTIGELPRGVPNNLGPYITQTAAGIRSELKIFGQDYDTPDGTCIRDFIHVSDLANAHICALKKLQSETSSIQVYNVGTGKGNTVLEVVQAFEKATGVKVNYKIVDRREGDIEKIWADASKAFTELQWKPQYSLEDAMLHAWHWEKSLRLKV
jgi:UDP-glucose 4-epimerase